MKTRLAILSALILPAFAQDVPTPGVDHFKITDQVLQKSPPNFSANLEIGGFVPWNPDTFVNVCNMPFSAGPIFYQYNGRADAGGENWLQNNTAPRISFWDCARSGFWDGADVYIYRIEGGVMKLLRKSKVGKSAIGNDPVTDQKTEEKIWFTDDGPAIQPGDFYVLRMKCDAPPQQIRKALNDPSGIPHLNGYCPFSGQGSWSFDESNPAPEGGSRASLRIEAKDASPSNPVGPWHWFVAPNEEASKLRFVPGKTYTAQIWLKQKGMSDPRVQLQFGTVMTRIVDVGAEWKKYEFDLPVENPEKPYANNQNESTKMWIGALSNGTLWMDNFLIWRTDAAPYALMPEEVATLKDFKPQVIRLWGGLDCPALDYWLSKGFSQPARGHFGTSQNAVLLSLGESLEACRSVGADPWLVVNPWFTAEENARLMEYLAGPPDKGYGKLRAEHGRVEPWTKAFNKIHLESANESWNQMMKYSLPSQPETYAAVADRQFREFKQSPYYDPAKFEMIANGWDNQMQRDGWTRRVALASKEADRVDVAYYFGGWEKGATPVASETEAVGDVYQDKLFTPALEFGPKIIDAATFDPDFLQRFAAVLRAEPELLAAGLAVMSAGQTQFTPGQLAIPSGGLAALWAKDEKFPERMKGHVASLRGNLEYPFWHAAYRAMAHEPSLQQPAAAALELSEPKMLPELADGLIDLNAPSRLLPLFKANPDAVQHWAQSTSMPPAALADLQAFLKTGDKLTYNITNELNKRFRAAILTVARAGNPEFLVALRSEATPEIIEQKMQYYLNGSIGSTLMIASDRRVEQLMKAMKADPVFANSALEAIANNPGIFHEEAASIASVIAANIASIHSGAESYKPEDESNLLMSSLPAEVRKELWQRLKAAADNQRTKLSAESAQLLAAMIAAQLGDTAPAKSLASDPGLAAILEARIAESIPLSFLKAAKNDARIGDQLATRFALTPAKNAKKLANYEGGPGYSLPGAGKVAPPEDENIGKSLALGTATLDASMQFLAAGSSPIAYYQYKTGNYWASHSNPQERIAYPSWLALKMRNTLCPGDLLKVEPLDVKRVDVPDKNVVKTTNDGNGSVQTVKGRRGVSLTTCHAFRDGGHLSILLINRSFTEPRTVALDLPPGFSGPSKQFALTNPDPKANNRKEENVKIQESAGPELKSGMQVVVPPASVVVISPKA
jgi:hypothetical protein